MDVIGEFTNLAAAIVDGPENWMPGMFDSPAGQITELFANTSLGRVSRHVRVELGRASRHNGTAVVPIRWHALDSTELFPVFDGRLRLRRRAQGGARLFIEGHYRPPGGAVGMTIDALAMRDIAEATVDDFVHRVAGVLARNALARTVARQVAARTLTMDAD